MASNRSAQLGCVFAALLLASPYATAQSQLLANPGFTMDLSGWDNFGDRPAQWSERDATNDPASGSAQISNVGLSNGNAPLVLTQCLPVQPDTEYGYGGSILVPPGQPSDTSAQLLIFTFPNSDCSGNFLSGNGISGVSIDSWLPLGRTFITPSGAFSIGFGIGVIKPSGVTSEAQALFDDLYLVGADGGGLITERLSGSWYNPATPGQGFFLDIAPETNLFFGGWFTWTSTPGVIDWMTVQGNYSGNVATVPIYRTTGGAFDDPAAVTTSSIGVAQFEFFSCTQGQVTIEFIGTGETIVIPLLRISPAFPGC